MKEILNDIKTMHSDKYSSFEWGHKLAEKCTELDNQLGKSSDLTRLHDNIYGRVFESNFVAELVNNPPVEVSDAMSRLSVGLARYLEKKCTDYRGLISQEIKKLLTQQDPRFWFPQVPEIENLKSYEGDVVAGLVDFLKKPKKTGIECICIPYMLTKISIVLKNLGFTPPWLEKADISYNSLLHPQVNGIRINRNEKDFVSSITGGITLKYQPTVVQKQGLLTKKI